MAHEAIQKILISMLYFVFISSLWGEIAQHWELLLDRLQSYLEESLDPA